MCSGLTGTGPRCPGWRFALPHAGRVADSISGPNLNALTGRQLRVCLMRRGFAGQLAAGLGPDQRAAARHALLACS